MLDEQEMHRHAKSLEDPEQGNIVPKEVLKALLLERNGQLSCNPKK